MSAADKFLNNRPLFGHAITLLISLIVVFTTYALNTGDYNDNRLNDKIDGKADIKYVDDRFGQHEQKQEVELNAIKKEIADYKETQNQILDLTKEIRDMTKTRLNRLEDKVYN